jgi:hypothetical protein
MRARAKENLPHVLLTLLSIIQALALELLWDRVSSSEFLHQLSWASAIYWCQVAATLLGILVIWVVYATNVMRFRWVPGVSDSVHPFLVGILQFLMIESLGPDGVGWWLVLLAIVFALMNWVAHLTMYRARRDEDNAEFFAHVKPATWRDFSGAIVSIVVLAVLGVTLIVWPSLVGVAMLSQLTALGLLGWQLWGVTYFWNRTMRLGGPVSSQRE